MAPLLGIGWNWINESGFSWGLDLTGGIISDKITKATATVLTENTSVTSGDLANGTGFQVLQPAAQIGTDNDESMSGEMWLFNPSSTTFVKHFFGTNVHPTNDSDVYMEQNFVAGYFNTTAAITAIQFKMGSGNIDSGTIKLYGLA